LGGASGPGVHRPEALRFGAFRNELQRDTVVAPAFSSKQRAVVKDVAMVAGATCAMIGVLGPGGSDITIITILTPSLSHHCARQSTTKDVWFGR
jgi:hypothetical protein